MPANVLDDIGAYVQDLDRRLHNIEMQATSGSGGGSNKFTSIIIDDGTDQITLDLQNPAPGAPAVVWGSFQDRIYADVSWGVVLNSAGYSLEYAKKIAGVYQIVNTQPAVGTAARAEPLEALTTYGFRVYSVNHAGVWSVASPWTDLTTGSDASVPGAVANVVVGRGATSVIVKFDGNAEVDVANGHGTYLVQISNDNFATVYAQQWSSSTIVAFNDVSAEGSFKGRVAAIDSSGNQGPWGTSTAFTAGGVIDSMLVGAFSAAHITFGTMSGDRITANTLDVATLKTSSLTTQTITLAGGSLKVLGGTGGTGLLINSQGVSLYNTSAVRTVFLDAATGDATFSGTLSGATGTFAGSLSAATGSIGALSVLGWVTTGAGGGFRTAAAGSRIEISTTLGNKLDIYTGVTGENLPGRIYGWPSGGGGSQTKVLELNSGNIGANALGTIQLSSQSFDGSVASQVALIAAGLRFSASAASSAAVTILAHGIDWSATGGPGVFSTHDGRIGVNTPSIDQLSWADMGVVVSSNGTGAGHTRAGYSVWADGVAIGWRLDTIAGGAWQSVDAAGTAYGAILASAFTVAPSSQVKKLNVRTMEPGALSSLKQMRPVRYKLPPSVPVHLDKDGNPTGKKIARHPANVLNEDRDLLGFIAEELVENLPEAIHWSVDEQGNQAAAGISIMPLVVLQAQAIQELAAVVEDLQATVGKLAGK